MTDPTARSPISVLAILLLTLVLAVPPGLAFIPANQGAGPAWAPTSGRAAGRAPASPIPAGVATSPLPPWAHGTPAQAFQALQANTSGPAAPSTSRSLTGAEGFDSALLNATAASAPPVRKDPAATFAAMASWSANRTAFLRSRIPRSVIPKSVPLHPDASLLPAGVPTVASAAAARTYTSHPPIVIESDAGFLSPSSGVVSGSGTATDPYIIAGWNISLDRDSTGITINDTRAHVIIEDNIVQSIYGLPTTGLFSFSMDDVQNVTIRQNIFLDASHIGHVYAPGTRHLSNITIEQNLFQDLYPTIYYPQDAPTPDPRDSCVDPGSTAAGDDACFGITLVGHGVAFDDNAIVNAPTWLYAVTGGTVRAVDQNASSAIQTLTSRPSLVDSEISGNLFYLAAGAQMWGNGDRITDNVQMYAWFRFGLDAFLNGTQPINENEFSIYGGANATLSNNTHVWSGGDDVVGDAYLNLMSNDAKVTNNTYRWAAGPLMEGAVHGRISGNSILGGGIWMTDSNQSAILDNNGTSYDTVGVSVRAGRDDIAANNVVQGPADYQGPVLYQDANLGLDVEGGTSGTAFPHSYNVTLRNNTANGFRFGLFTGTPHLLYLQAAYYPANVTLEDNHVNGSQWGLVLWGPVNTVLHGNRIDNAQYAVDYEPLSPLGTSVQADPSNTVNGVPMFLGHVTGNRTFDGAVQPYAYLGILGGDHIRIVNQTMTRSGYALFLYHDKLATVSRTVFGQNFISIFAGDSNLTVENSTFHLDRPYSVVVEAGRLRAVNDAFTSDVAPQWWPWPLTLKDIWLVGSTGSIIRNVTFENALTALEATSVKDLTVADSHVLGGGVSLLIGGDTGTRIVGNTFVNTYYAILNAGSSGAVIARNALRGVGVGIVSTSEHGVVRDNVVDAAYYGIVKAGASGDYTVSGLVANNTVLMHEVGWSVGVLLGNVPGGWTLNARNNTVIAPGGWGIYVSDEGTCTSSGGLAITHNTVRWARWGVLVACAVYPNNKVTPRTHLHGNAFGGDRWAVAVTNPTNSASNITLDATGNWWGDASGPSGPGYAGHGDAVYALHNNLVVADPWLKSAPSMASDLPLNLTTSTSSVPTGTPVTFHLAPPAGTALSSAFLTTADGVAPLVVQNGTTVHTFLRPGDLRLYAVGRTPDGRSGAAALTLHVLDRKPTLTIVPDAVAVAGTPTRFVTTASDPDGYVSSLTWRFGDGTVARWGVPSSPAFGAPEGSAVAASPAMAPLPVPSTGVTPVDPTLIKAVHEAAPGDPVQVIVATRGPAAAPAAEAAARFGARVHSVWTIVNGFSAEVPAANVLALAHEPWVQMATTEHAFRPAMVSATNETHARAAWATGYLGKGVTIAIVDSGITDSHPDLAGKVLTGMDFSYDCPYESSLTPAPCGNANDTDGHGTLAAGLAAGTGALSHGAFAGVAPGASLVDLKIFDRSGLRSVEAYQPMMDALQWIQNNGSRYGIRVVYIGMTSTCQYYGCALYNGLAAEAADNLVNQGYVVVLPAGNDGEAPNTIDAPGVSRNAITVGAVNDQGTANVSDDVVTMWSSRGGNYRYGKPDLVAPGLDITSTAVGAGQAGYESYSGTSASAAIVAGMAALLLQKDPSLTPAQVKTALTSTAIKLPLDQGPTPNANYGYGLADVQAALAAVPGRSPLVRSVTYQEPGAYQVTVTGTDNQGQTTITRVPLTVHGVDPSFAASTLQPFEGTTVTFQDTSNTAPNANLTYAWTFGDGNTSTAKDPTHAFVSPGTYTVTENVTEIGIGSYVATKALHVLVNDHQAPNTTATPNVAFAEGWAPGPVTYTLHATDHGGAGVATTYTMLDDGSPQGQAPNGSITVTGDGHHALSYWSVDGSGNREAMHTTFLGIDTKAPTAQITSPRGTRGSGLTLYITGHLTIDAQASDAGSGIQHVTFQDDGVTFAQTSGHGNGAYGATWPAPGAPAPSPGLHTLTTTVTDVVGHTTTASTQVLVVPWPTS